MPDNTMDPSGNTEAFRAFTDQPAEPEAASRTPLIAGGVVVAVAVIALLLWMLL